MSTSIRTPRLLATAALLGACSLVQAGLLGSTVSLEYNFLDSTTHDSLVVGNGVEASCPGGLTLCNLLTATVQTVDFGDTTITYRYTGGPLLISNGGINGFDFRDLNGLSITGVTLSTDMYGFDMKRVTFDQNSVQVVMEGLETLAPDGYFTLSLATDTGNQVPEPGTMA
ncbi:MAG: hypothetical protein CFE45_28865 [Burkholderiales bacterium PBB5]|nr:MAG: hypothetical protein CFE45_28865 [Burkholderiales bacterium PBB5]